MATKVPVKPLGFMEDKSLRERKGVLEDMRDNVEVTQGVQHEVSNKKAITEELGRIEKTLANHSVAEMDLSKDERSQIEKEEEALRVDLQKDMPTWTEYSTLTPKHGARYQLLVQKIGKWNVDHTRRSKIMRWKTLRRLLDPHNPKADSTIFLFPQ